MDYTLPRLRFELANAAQAILSADKIEVADAKAEIEADLTVPTFALARQFSKSPHELATHLAAELKHELVEKSEASGGYVNIWLKTTKMAERVLADADKESYGHNTQREGQNILVEHTDPNPFKELHIGHLYSNTVGEAVCRLFEASGASVHRISYHGDVGLHIARAVWAAGQAIDWQSERINELNSDDIGYYYAEGTAKAETDEQTKAAVMDINKKIYQRSDETVNAIYDWGKSTSLAYFDQVYQRLGTPSFEKQYMESASGPAGLELVRANMDKFDASDGAVVYRGEQEGEHTRVFITSENLPTYESKELGLTVLKETDWPDATLSVVITANEINAYFKVVLAALREIKPELAAKTQHLSHGIVKLPSGKMSSRSGNVVKAVDLLDEVVDSVRLRVPEAPAAEDNALAAIKYAFLRPSVGGDIVYDIDESIKLDGQTGPYIQYAAVRISSILEKVQSSYETGYYDWQTERNLLVLVSRFPEVVQTATQALAPSLIAHFAYELAKEFNRYYETTPVKDAPDNVRSARLKTLTAVHYTLSHSLNLLNIPVPKRM